jgi:beta-phosphoglucomutase
VVRGLIFDVDGVLVDSPHEAAWGDALRRLMESEWADLAAEISYSPEAYTAELYREHVSGKPRLDGARALLQRLGIADADDVRAKELAAAKQRRIAQLIRQGEFRAFEDGVSLALCAKTAGMLLAAASSSKNANTMLERVPVGVRGATLVGIFDANVCGREFRHGKPHPEIFLTAARELGLPAGECVVVEDAAVGAAAAKAGGMMCIGVARNDGRRLLRESGADWVVRTLEAVVVKPDGTLEVAE